MSLRILICDADRRFVERACRFLSHHGHQAMAEPLGDEALELARRWKPDVIVLSSELADGDPDGVLEELKQLRPRPAILLTGHLDRFDAAWRCWRKGGDELLLKPVVHAWELHSAIVSAMEACVPAIDEAVQASPA